MCSLFHYIFSPDVSWCLLFCVVDATYVIYIYIILFKQGMWSIANRTRKGANNSKTSEHSGLFSAVVGASTMLSLHYSDYSSILWVWIKPCLDNVRGSSWSFPLVNPILNNIIFKSNPSNSKVKNLSRQHLESNRKIAGRKCVTHILLEQLLEKRNGTPANMIKSFKFPVY